MRRLLTHFTNLNPVWLVGIVAAYWRARPVKEIEPAPSPGAQTESA